MLLEDLGQRDLAAHREPTVYTPFDLLAFGVTLNHDLELVLAVCVPVNVLAEELPEGLHLPLSHLLLIHILRRLRQHAVPRVFKEQGWVAKDQLLLLSHLNIVVMDEVLQLLEHRLVDLQLIILF